MIKLLSTLAKKGFKKLHIVLILVFAWGVCSHCFAGDDVSKEIAGGVRSLLHTQVADSHEFFGLAAYYNDTRFVWVGDDQIGYVDSTGNDQLEKKLWLALVGRFNVAVWDASSFELSNQNYDVDGLFNVIEKAGVDIQVLPKSDLANIAPELEKVKYHHLWGPLASLTRLIEACLVGIESLVGNWGGAIIVFGIFVKLLLSPLSLLTAKLQREAGVIKTILTPKLNEIKSLYDGEDAHTRIMSAHKELGVGPFYSLKPLLVTLLQIPILIATFNALGEMPQLDGEQFLWIDNLAYPDKVLGLGISIPLLGDGLNLLPILMTIVSLLATVTFNNDYESRNDIRKQKRNLFLMALFFLFLFYPFPASMVLYWMTSNTLHLVQQKILK